MPSTASSKDGKKQTSSDMFTRLSIANCTHDLGVRPLTCGCPGWLSPAFEFSQFPLLAGEESRIHIGIKNYGAMDASTVTLELAYNLWLGNEAEGMVTVATSFLPTIAALGSYTSDIAWTPPDTPSTHACLHARVIDLYSLLNHADRNSSWDPYVNPQVANRNVTLVPIQDANKAAVINYTAKNWGKNLKINARALVTEYSSRPGVLNPNALFPIPFLPDKLFAKKFAMTEKGAIGQVGGFRRGATIGGHNMIIGGIAMPHIAPNTLWPTPEITPEFIHTRFGFDIEGRLPNDDAFRVKRGINYFMPNRKVPLKSLYEFALNPGEEILVQLIIPPEQFPPPGQRTVLRVQYQVGTDRPLDHFVYLSR